MLKFNVEVLSISDNDDNMHSSVVELDVNGAKLTVSCLLVYKSGKRDLALSLAGNVENAYDIITLRIKFENLAIERNKDVKELKAAIRDKVMTHFYPPY